jgi:penicillin-binding protein 1A
MATRRVEPHVLPRRIIAQARPVKKKKRFRRLRRIVKIGIALSLAGIAAWVYVLQVYAPGLRVEAQSLPARVREGLAAQGAQYSQLSQISPYLRQAIVAIEDRRFYMHPGVDPLGMARAFWVDLTNQHIDQGGSTLEQQLVKRTIVPDDRSVHGKVRTIALAWAVDQEFGKSQILELYLNAAYYGRGAYGPDAAARTYFGVDVGNLTLPQAAFLAALPQAPSVFGANPTAPGIQQRWITVLQDMRNAGDITPQQADEAEHTRLAFAFG